MNKTKKDFHYSIGIFEEGSATRVFVPEVSLGYAILDNNRFRLSPFLGFGAMRIYPTETMTKETPELKEVIKTSVNFPIGISFDIRTWISDYLRNRDSNYGFIRIRYSYNVTRFHKRFEDISGNMHCITIGFGSMARGVRREY